MKDILGMVVDIKDIERTNPTNTKNTGVVKVELVSVDDKITVLCAKRK